MSSAFRRRFSGNSLPFRLLAAASVRGDESGYAWRQSHVLSAMGRSFRVMSQVKCNYFSFLVPRDSGASYRGLFPVPDSWHGRKGRPDRAGGGGPGAWRFLSFRERPFAVGADELQRDAGKVARDVVPPAWDVGNPASRVGIP